MARKSATLRLSQANKLYSSYQEADLTELKGGRFIRDMISRLERGKGLSKGQRNWLDSLIEEGVPKPKGDQALLSKIDDAVATLGMESKISVLKDFRRKVFNGWNLSPKQTQWLNDMIIEAQELRVSGPWAPTDEQIQLMRDISDLSRGYNSAYWATHGGTFRAVEKIREYLNILEDYDAKEPLRIELLCKTGLDEWCINKAKKAMNGRLRELREKPYAKAGDLVWTRYQPDGSNWNDLQWFQAPVCGPPEVSSSGNVVYPILNPMRGLIEVTKDQISKRKPRR